LEAFGCDSRKQGISSEMVSGLIAFRRNSGKGRPKVWLKPWEKGVPEFLTSIIWDGNLSPKIGLCGQFTGKVGSSGKGLLGWEIRWKFWEKFGLPEKQTFWGF